MFTLVLTGVGVIAMSRCKGDINETYYFDLMRRVGFIGLRNN